MTAKGGKRCVVVTRLGPGLLAATRLWRLAGWTVFYHDLAPALRGAEATARLASLGIAPVPYETFAAFTYYGHLSLARDCARRLMDETFDESLKASVTALVPEIDDRDHKVTIGLFEKLVGDVWTAAIVANAARHLEAEGWTVQVLGLDWVERLAVDHGGLPIIPAVPSAMVAAADALRRGAARALSLVRRRQYQAAARAPVPSGDAPVGTKARVGGAAATAEVLFFPHKGLNYGELFLKDAFYSADPDSPFHQAAVHHVEIGPVDPDVDESYARLGVAYSALPALGVGIGRLAATARRVLGGAGGWWRLARRPILTAYQVLVSAGLIERVASYRRALTVYSNAKIALIGYDLLFPKALAIAAQAHGIKLVAAQERVIMTNRPTSALILDVYLVAGDASAQRIRATDTYAVAEIRPTGLVRSDMLRRMRADKPKDGGRPTVLVLDYHSDPGALAACTFLPNNWANNRLFYEDIARLAAEVPEADFVLRSKDDLWREMAYFDEVAEKLAALPNVEIANTYKAYNLTYTLAAEADLILGRHTSIMDEAMTLGIPVLVHDKAANSDRLVTTLLDYDGAPMFAHDYAAMKAGVAAFLAGRPPMPDRDLDRLRRRYYGPAVDGPVKPRIDAVLMRVLDRARAERDEPGKDNA